MTDPERILLERIGVTFKNGTYSEGRWRDASNDPCPICGNLVLDHSMEQLQTCLRRGDLEHIRCTGKPITKTVNGMTRQVDAHHPSGAGTSQTSVHSKTAFQNSMSVMAMFRQLRGKVPPRLALREDVGGMTQVPRFRRYCSAFSFW